MNKRINYFDIAKGVLIIFLLFHHYYSAVIRLPGTYPALEYLTAWQTALSCFFMQCFFFLSGFCTTTAKPWKDFLYSQFRQLVVPNIVFCILIYIINLVVQQGGSAVSPFAWGSLYGDGGGFWFLWALFIAKIILFTLIRMSRGNSCAILSISFVLMLLGLALKNYEIGSNLFFIRHGLGSCFTLALGFYAKNHQELFSRAMSYSASLFPWILVFFLMLEIPIPIFTSGMNVCMRQIPAFIIISTAGSLAFLMYMKVLEPRLNAWRCTNVFTFFGKGSIVVYGLHFPFLKQLVHYFNGLLTPDTAIEKTLYFFSIYSCEIIICALLVALFRMKGLSWLMGR